MIFKINARGENEVSRHFRIVDVSRKEITDERLLNELKLVIKTIAKTIDSIDNNISDKERDVLIYDVVYDFNQTLGIQSLIEDVLHELGYKFYLKEIEKKEEIVNL